MRVAQAGHGAGWTEHPADAIVVAGARVRADGTPSPALVRRTLLGAALYLDGRAPILLLTGRGPGPIPEADLMADIAMAHGVPADAIVRERHAMTTRENAAYSRKLTEAPRILVVTDDTHVRRCVRVFGRHFDDVRGVGARTSFRARSRGLVREALVEAWREG